MKRGTVIFFLILVSAVMSYISRDYEHMQNSKTVSTRKTIDLGAPIHIIPLGNSCYSRVHPERFHLFDFKKNNKVRMPFDGCKTPYHTMCHLIETDFANYDRNPLKIDSRGAVVDELLGIHYEHERTKDISSIKEQLNKRKSQFMNTINNSIKNKSIIVFFLVHEGYPQRLVDILVKKYPSLNFNIFNLDTTIYTKIKPIQEKQHVTYVNIPKPNNEYKMDEKSAESGKGQIFERKILNAFLSFLTKISGVTYNAGEIFNHRDLRVRGVSNDITQI